MNKIFVLGLGPGAVEYILPIVFEQIKDCSVLIGGKRNLEIFSEYNIQKIGIEGKYSELKKIIREQLANGNVGIPVSGDPGYYSLLSTLLRYFDKNIIEVIPGISSLQYLFSKGVLPWQDAQLLSFHGKEIDNLSEILSNHNKIGFLTDTKNSPDVIAKKIMELGYKNKKAIVGERLSYPDEKIYNLSIDEVTTMKFNKLSVMIIYE